MKTFIILIFSCCIIVQLNAQSQINDGGTKDRKNAVYVQNFIIFPNVYYDRIIPIQSNFGIIPRVGFGTLNPVLGLNFYYGNNRRKVEIGGAYWDFEGFFLNINYRYSGKKGLLFKIGYEYIPGEEGSPFLALGYCF